MERAVFGGLGVLVMGYPCAAAISAPLSIVRGAGQSAEHGILMRTGEAFQGFRTVKQIVLEKTGTLAEGRPICRLPGCCSRRWTATGGWPPPSTRHSARPCLGPAF